jgi:hypothetical protein
MLEDVLNHYLNQPFVPPVPPAKNEVEQLCATAGVAVPPVPPVPPEKIDMQPQKQNTGVTKISQTEGFVLKKCRDCLHFKCFNQHGGGPGYCLVGAKDRLWSEREHACKKFDAAIEHGTQTDTPGALIVTCYTPMGNPIKVQADSEQYADWLIKMNPKPKRKMP